MRRKAICIFLFLIVIFFSFSLASAGKQARPAKYQKKKVEKSVSHVRPDRPENYKEKSALVNVSSSDVFFRDSQESERVTEVLLGDEFRVVGDNKEWAYGYLPSQKGYRGWIRKENLSFSSDSTSVKDKPIVQVRNAKARITFRDGSFLNVYAGTRLPLLSRDNRRYEVIVPDGSTGYLPVEAAWVEEERFGKEVTPKDILQASKFYGSDYKWGGITASGMDCSGFVYTAFRLNGIYLKRDSHLQAEEGADVPIDQLQAGDLVFFRSEKVGRITHVGIYIDNGNFIHASRSKKGVSVSSLSDEYFRKNFAGARRILTHVDRTVQMKQNKDQHSRPLNKNEV
ncbi:MAG: C40 family peptidase [Thermodesulfovibrionales bacterium]